MFAQANQVRTDPRIGKLARILIPTPMINHDRITSTNSIMDTPIIDPTNSSAPTSILNILTKRTITTLGHHKIIRLSLDMLQFHAPYSRRTYAPITENTHTPAHRGKILSSISKDRGGNLCVQYKSTRADCKHL
jgi:hypothetical protein